MKRHAGTGCTVALFSGLLIAGCQYDFPVRVQRQGDQYIFSSARTAGRFAPHTCVNTLRVLEGEAVIWAIRNPAVGWPHEGGTCERSNFPLVYGLAPAGFETIVPPRPLRPGTHYRIQGGGVSGYHGAFTINADLTVSNRRR